jgi:DNA-binding NarL/FixJ family response regulator
MTIEALETKTLRVVIVDDTADLRELLRFALARGGMAVVGEAGDGLAGIEVVRATRPDVVLLDLSMPVMDGLEALPQIRASAPEARIIVLSGFGATQMAQRALAIGADGYLQKGASLGRILDQIRDIVEGRTTGPASLGEPATEEPEPELRRKPVVAPEANRDAVELAPIGILEVLAEPPYRLRSINAAAGRMIEIEPETDEPLEQCAPAIAAAIANSRLAGDGKFETFVGRRPVLVTVCHTATSLLLYLQPISDEIGYLRNAIAVTAHEIRGPVSVLCAITETILEDELEAHQVDRLMSSIIRQSRLLDSITGDLLVAAQVQRGTLRIDAENIDPTPIVETVMEDHHIPAGLIATTDDRWILADPLRLQQMLGNLISNAVKYGQPPVHLQVRPSRDHDALVCIDVIDHGPGVPTEFRSQLFREFSRAAGTAVLGNGLGLHVVQMLARGQGGSVSYAPREGGGSVFTLSLPAATRRQGAH